MHVTRGTREGYLVGYLVVVIECALCRQCYTALSLLFAAFDVTRVVLL